MTFGTFPDHTPRSPKWKWVVFIALAGLFVILATLTGLECG